MIKAIFFDIDGTLVSHTKKDIPEGVLTALDELRAKGILLFIASGRHISEFPALPLHDYPFDGYVTQTGQICYNGAFETIYEQPFTDEDTESLVRMFNEREIPIVLLNDRSLYINFVNEYVVRTQNAINTPIPPIDSYHGEKLYGATVFGESATGWKSALPRAGQPDGTASRRILCWEKPAKRTESGKCWTITESPGMRSWPSAMRTMIST